jgi:hypothetical protein
MPQPRDARDVHRESAHAIDVGTDVDRTDNRAQVAGHRLLQREQPQRGFLGLAAEQRHLLMVGDDLLGEGQVGL